MSIVSKNSLKDGAMKELFKLGAHFGFSRARRHPSTEGYIFGFKNRQAVLDLEKSISSLEEAKDFVKTIAGKGKLLLLVGAKNEIRSVIASAANTINMPYVNERWLGGTLTNFKELRKRTARLLEIRDGEKTGDLNKYTKKERGVIAQEKSRLERYFASLIPLTELPGAMLVVDVNEEAIAVAEAKKLNIPVITLSNSDCDIRGISYPIVGNDSAQGSVRYFVNELVEAYREGATVKKEVEGVAEVATA
ncbi:MAG: 30S ribosomal protein S2 [Candidatus Pacebacteria bacterium]|nr:30S ribosomal protein S2 [Candidatus Paceibacterota bacterium]